MAKKIYINPGHSNTDPGAVKYATERELNVKVGKYMNEYLLANYESVQTKVSSGTINSLSTISKQANQWKADLFVSIHFNAGGGDGFECYVYSKKRTDLGKVFAKHVKAIGQNLRSGNLATGVKSMSTLAVLRLTDMPAILCEGAFVDNKKDITDWDDDAELKKLGAAYAMAAAEYLKLTQKVVKPVEPAEPAEPAKHIYRVQVGAYSNSSNAEAMLDKLEKAGFSGVITKSEK